MFEVHRLSRDQTVYYTIKLFYAIKMKFGTDFRHQSPLKCSSFKTEQHIGSLQQVSGT